MYNVPTQIFKQRNKDESKKKKPCDNFFLQFR